MCHIIGIEPQFENIIANGPFIPMTAGQRKLEAQWTADERKAASLDQRLKSLIMPVLPDDQMNSVDKKEVASDDEKTKVKSLMALTDEERISVGKASARNDEWIKITKKSNLHKSYEVKDSTLPNHDTDE
nr:retrovirus-related Pol polyprotein from transposon TNT 1-94 [Tanacetum cinerariifolium]